MLQHVTHNYIINFVEGLFPLVSEAYCGYTSLHEYVIMIFHKSFKINGLHTFWFYLGEVQLIFHPCEQEVD